LAFSSNFFGSITHRGGRDARVPVLRRLSAAFANIKNFSAPLGDEGKPRPYNVNVFWFGAIEIPVRFGDPVVGLCRRYSPRKPGGRLPTLRSPTRFGVPFKLVRFYYAQRRAGRTRSSPRRFAADVCGTTRVFLKILFCVITVCVAVRSRNFVLTILCWSNMQPFREVAGAAKPSTI
jgi:hypothetical protein